MTTLLLQGLVTLLLLAFGIVSIVTAHAIGSTNSLQHGLWRVTGFCLTVYGVNKLVQGVWGAWAFLLGSGTEVYDGFIRVAPIFNHSRTVLLFALYGALTWVALRGKLSVRAWRCVIGAAVVALGLGGLVGYHEGALLAGRHYATTAIIDTVGFAVLAVVLMVLLVRDSADRLLWFALACQGFRSIIGVLFMAAMSWADTPGAWTPPLWSVHAVRIGFVATMVVLAAARLRAALRGRPVPGLLPQERQPRIALG